MKTITLVDYSIHNCPVAYDGKVYQCCVRDWEGEIVLKDDISGVHIFDSAKIKDEDILPLIKHVSVNGYIQFGDTISLQKLLNSIKP